MSSKTKASATMDEARPEMVPKLRFPEFRGAEGWSQKQLSDLCELITKGATPTSYGFSYVDDGVHFVKIESLVDGSIDPSKTAYITEECNKAFFRSQLKENDILFSIAGALGVIALVEVKILPANINQAIALVRLKHGQSHEFLLHQLQTNSIQSEIQRIKAGAAQPNVSLGQLGDFAALLPSPAEQQKIAECLSSVDELMAAQARKVDALKTHKKGLMQQLFPREGETRPRLRFPEFQNAAAWEVKAIGDVFRVTRGEVLSMTLVNDEASNEAPFPVYSSQTKNKGLAGYYSEHLYEDAITWTTDGANAGDVNFRPGKFYCTNVCGVLINANGCANVCIAALLNSVTRSHVSYVGNPKLMNGVMAKIEIPFPSVPEQQLIASCLNSLDALITAETQKLEALKTHKKGLMQQLFPSPVEVEA
ncbi:restriction endonuclease subunit S [Acidithiobacillus sp.]|jgi:type I restriction enzyme S subunit|uniref:restriction endonuclease subunit S n=1 Tax=Acidithiobacillus sp. TaxID=1872118 RepID=UPI0025C70B92|nr:restriction endonuclease subunit S [Acidithiobacillus sp.]MCK9188134.1 restriction endonuclease subunit S [Acidithiobacillus sp.]MCK9360342.1 restriction endonuclease subunit S [Acidithiobacillus sp.]